ncbi:MAG: amino acid ABC transporter substrate-binding protein [bacterium]|nr:amino acid ABC transporter substrate-binding protein [bacterium]
MKRIGKVLSLLLMLSMVLSACGSKSASTGEDTSLKYIKDKGELVLGLDASFPPMGFKDDSGNIVGFDIDLAKEVCSRMGVTLKLQPVDWNNKEMELTTKNIDLIWNGLSYSQDRNDKMTLSESYMTNRQVMVVLKDSSIQTLADLKGKTVSLQSGSTASEAMDKNKEVKDSLKEVVKIDDNVKAMMDLQVNGSDAVAMDEVVARYYSEQNQGKYRILDETLSDEQYVVGFRKGDQQLCDEVMKYLKEMKNDGKLAEISTKWFGSDITTIK